ncbi:MAG: queuosine precursor transporter [Candidatus Cloacimonetes bacterium]|nr:queuosine precursor transporter [Candidatus Cloacimonadota bacterium]
MNFREKFFYILFGIFLTSLIVGNLIGVTKFVNLGGFFIIPAGLLAYPVTFLATDLICELYGKAKAQWVVLTGFIMNLFMLVLMHIGHILPDASGISGATSTFESVYGFMVGNVLASMVAYFIAQSVDVRLFHFWKSLTAGKHLWIRNNFSTMTSQILDTVCILSILYIAGGLGDGIQTVSALLGLMWSSYLFKFCFAILDTPFLYIGVYLYQRLEGSEKSGTIPGMA